MPYATPDDVKSSMGTARYMRLVDLDRDGVEDPEEVAGLTAALDSASTTADSYIRRYLPLTAPYPTSLRKAVVDLAVFDFDPRPTEKTKKAYSDSVQWLRDIGKGTAELDVITVAAEDPFLIDAPEPNFAYEGPLP